MVTKTTDHYGGEPVYRENSRRKIKVVCSVCGNTYLKRISDFKRYGIGTCSRSCAAKKGAKVRNEKHGMFGENNPNWKGGVSENKYRYKKRQMKRNPEKFEARREYRSAIRSGELEREPCVVCGNDEVHGHHDDYSRPLDVVWLCRKHHRMVHCYAPHLDKMGHN